MIVEPDFLTHWKTQMLCSELQDKGAALLVIGLWAHCQQRKSDSFRGLTSNALKAICRWEGEADKLKAALELCGFIKLKGDAIIVHGFAERNAKLFSNWNNGKTGGRPSKEKRERKPSDNKDLPNNPNVTQPKPNDNPNGNMPNPNVTDKSREDKTRVEGSREDAIPKSLSEASKDFSEWFCSLGIDRPSPAIFVSWQECYDELVRIDGQTDETIRAVCKWAREDHFWKTNFMSPLKLRRKNSDKVSFFQVFKAKLDQPKQTTLPIMGRNGKAYEAIPSPDKW